MQAQSKNTGQHHDRGNTNAQQKHRIVTFLKTKNDTDNFCPKIAIDLATIDSISQDRETRITIIKQKSGGKIKLSEDYDHVCKVWGDWLADQNG